MQLATRKRKKIKTGTQAGKGKGLSLIINQSEPKKLNMIEDFVSLNDIIFDIGANIGIYTLIFSKYAKKVYAFEPLPRNYYYLQRTLNINGVENVHIINKAISDRTRTLYFEKGDSWATGSISNEGEIKISSITLDNFCDSNKISPDFLKIDVEGAEYSVLKGAKNILSKNKPGILIEIHGTDTKIKCFEYLKELDYNYFKRIMINKRRGIEEYLFFSKF